MDTNTVLTLFVDWKEKSYSSLNDSTQHLRGISKEYILLAIIALQKFKLRFTKVFTACQININLFTIKEYIGIPRVAILFSIVFIFTKCLI
jgi:hypothetical protein